MDPCQPCDRGRPVDPGQPCDRGQQRGLGRHIAPVVAFMLAGPLFAACASTSSETEQTTTTNVARDETPSTRSTIKSTIKSTTGVEAETTEAASLTTIGPDYGGPSFADDVMPVLEQNCVSCHSSSGPGTAHVRFETAAQVATLADFIGSEVEDRHMPPWRLSGLEDVKYKYSPRITNEERQTIVDWVNQGATLDLADDAALVARGQTHPTVEADLVLRPDDAYPDSGQLDDYRCRIIDPAFGEPSWIRAIEVLPDQKPNLHHAVLFKLFDDVRGQAEQLDGSDGKPGWSCPTVPLQAVPLPNLGGWAPGAGPIILPERTGIQMKPGDAFIVQWHYHYDSGPIEDNSGLGIQLATKAELENDGGRLEPLRSVQLLGPVEIPCSRNEQGPLCDRDRAIDRIRQEFGDQAAGIPGFVNRLCGVTPATYAQMIDGQASSSCDLPAPVGHIISIWPHMHELGIGYRLTLNPGTQNEKVLVDIDQWDFQWQTGYSPAEPLVFERGDALRIECKWDRSLWPEGVESRYVVWAEGTHDEMCYTSIGYRRG